MLATFESGIQDLIKNSPSNGSSLKSAALQPKTSSVGLDMKCSEASELAALLARKTPSLDGREHAARRRRDDAEEEESED